MGQDQPEHTMRGRIGTRRDRFRLYILLNAHRLLLTGVLTIAMIGFLLLVGARAPFRQYMIEMAPSLHIFQALVAAVITGVTLVVTINQLVLSQEIGPVGTHRERMRNAMSFRADVEDLFGSTSPPEPEAFLQALVDNSRERAQVLQDAVAENANDALREDVDQFTGNLIEHAEDVKEQLEDREFGEYEVVEAILNYNYGAKIFQARRIRDTHGDDLSEDGRRALTELLHVLTFLGTAREYVKTLYFQWELVDLSRNIIYTAIPALAVTAALGLFLSPTMFPGETLGIDNLVWIVSIGVTAGIAPFLLLATYIIRLATIAKHTLAIGPFILRASERSSDIDWD